METRYLQSFLKVAETGSISRAAESLGITQPSLSHQILRLEDELGSKLFRRTARGVALTEAGRLFHGRAQQILQGARQALEDVRQLENEPTGSVILAVPQSISRIAGVALVKAFLDHAPQVSFRLVESTTGQIRGWLDLAKVDLGILVGLGPLRHLSAREIATEELFLIGPPGAYGTLAELPDTPACTLEGIPFILPGLPHGLRQIIEVVAADIGIALTVRQELDALAHIGPLISAGYGHSLLPLSIVSEDLIAGRVSIARVEGGAFSRTLSIVRNSGQIVTHASVRGEDLTLKVLRRLIDKGAWNAKPGAALV
jgi:LysR family transcriptional regulator, nitrogen assimilation regulatory protein